MTPVAAFIYFVINQDRFAAFLGWAGHYIR